LNLALQYNFVTELTSLIVVEESVYEQTNMTNETYPEESFGMVNSPEIDDVDVFFSNSGVLKLTAVYCIVYAAVSALLFC